MTLFWFHLKVKVLCWKVISNFIFCQLVISSLVFIFFYGLSRNSKLYYIHMYHLVGAGLITEKMERASTMQSVHENIKSVRGQLKKVYKTLNTLENWRKAILLVCVVALGVDPLFLFIPVIDSPNFCFTFDKKLAAVVSAIRTFIDTFYVIHIIFNFITEFIAPRSQVSLRGELIVHSKAMRKRLFFFHFIVDICSVIPIPQVCVHFLSPSCNLFFTMAGTN